MVTNARPDGVKLIEEAIAAIERGELIRAIKITRANTGLGLKESKEAVEAYLETHPDTKAKMLANKTTASLTQENLVHILIVLIGAAVAYWMFFAAK